MAVEIVSRAWRRGPGQPVPVTPIPPAKIAHHCRSPSLAPLMQISITLVALFWLGATAPPAGAQKNPDVCGSLPLTQQGVDRLARYFTDEEYEEVRGAELSQLPANSQARIVTNRGICSHAIHAALRVLSGEQGFSRLRDHGNRYRVLQFGPYYAVLMVENQMPGRVRLGWSPLLIFRGPQMEYRAVILT